MQDNKNYALPVVVILLDAFIFGLPASWGLSYISSLCRCPAPGYLVTVGLLVFFKSLILEGRRVWD